MLELYHHGSSACAAKVRFALAEKQIGWTSRYVDILRGEQFAPQFLVINPKAVVPVLAHDGEIIPESTIICEYLEDAFPERPLLPASPLQRARVRWWTKAVDEELHPGIEVAGVDGERVACRQLLDRQLRLHPIESSREVFEVCHGASSVWYTI